MIICACAPWLVAHTRLLLRNSLQTPAYIMHSCTLHKEARNQFWHHGATLEKKLWGSQEQLETTVHFILPQTSKTEAFLKGTLKKK